MHCDDSSTEIKLTDVTHCDLETKSILKPPKVRAPLQEVDLGNQITVEFDVIRKRRVSFAGVNRIKEFNSEAKSFSICNTPAYDEKVSISSDSSALSTSVSGNLNILIKENDITLLDDTMDLTDLSVCQPSCAMDITVMKTTQKPSQGVPDIFVPKNQHSAAFDGQAPGKVLDQLFMRDRNNDENEKLVSGVGPGQTGCHNLVKPVSKPPVLDPKKILLDELLEDSVVDIPMEKYLKANSLFVQNKLPLVPDASRHNLGVGKYSLNDCKRTLPEVSEMSSIGAVPVPVDKHIFPVSTVVLETQQKNFDTWQTLPNATAHNPPNLFGIPNVDMDESKLAMGFQSNVSQMEFTESLPFKKIQTLDRNNIHKQNRDECRPVKGLSMSQLEFTQVLPSKYSHTMQHTVAEKQSGAYDNFSTNVFNISQMEITEALPLRNIQGVPSKMEAENLCGNENISISNRKRHENQTFVTSNMEFTEALPIHKPITKECNANSILDLDAENIGKSIPQKHILGNRNQDLNDSCSMEISINPEESDLLKRSVNNFEHSECGIFDSDNKLKKPFVQCADEVKKKSQKLLTETLPILKPTSKQTGSNSEDDLPGIFNNISPRNNSGNEIISQLRRELLNDSNSMDVTELNNDQVGLIYVEQLSSCKQKECIEINKNIVISLSQLKQSDNAVINESYVSQMEFTEALPWKNIQSNSTETESETCDNDRNAFTAKRKSLAASNINQMVGNSSCMEFTEALPLYKQEGSNFRDVLLKSFENVKSTVSISENIVPLEKDRLCESDVMDVTKLDHLSIESISGNLTQNENVFNIKKSNVKPVFQLEKNNSRISRENEMSLMEFTEVLPLSNVQSVTYAKINEGLNKENYITVPNSIVATNVEYYENLSLQSSLMEFTEALPKQKLIRENTKFKDSSSKHCENIEPSVNISQNKNITPIQDNLVDSFSMDVSEIDHSVDHDDLKNIKDNVNIDCYINKENMVPNACYNSIGSEVHQKQENAEIINSQNYPAMFSSHNISLVGGIEGNISQMELTEALPSRNSNHVNSAMRKEPLSCDKNAFVSTRKNLMTSSGNHTLGASHMEITEAVFPPQSHVIEQTEVALTPGTPGENTSAIPSDFKLSGNKSERKLAKLKEVSEISQMEFTGDIHPYKSLRKTENGNLMYFSPESCLNIIKDGLKDKRIPLVPVLNLEMTNVVTQMDFTENVKPCGQLLIKGELQLNQNIEDPFVNNSNLLPQVPSGRIDDPYSSISQMEFTKAVPSQIPETKIIGEDNVILICNQKLNICPIDRIDPGKDVSKQNYGSPLSQKASSLSDAEFYHPIQSQKEVKIKNQANEKSLSVFIDGKEKELCITNQESNNLNDIGEEVSVMRSVFSEQNLNSNDPCSKICAQSYVGKSHVSKNDYELNKHFRMPETYKSEYEPPNNGETGSQQNFVVSQVPIIDDNAGKVLQCPTIITGLTESNNSECGAVLAKPKENNEYSKIVDTEYDEMGNNQKKSLVHFNTPPVRNVKKRKTMGPLNPDETRKLSQISSSNLTMCFNDVSNFNCTQEKQNKEQLEAVKKSYYDPEKGNEEWERLVKNDSFMKVHLFEFVRPYRWKYKFKWPLELILEIPEIEVNEKTRKKNISLVSKISESDPLSVFVDNRMKKNMSVILSEHWLNSHCKTIKDLLFTINFIEEEYNKLDPLFKSLKYFYNEFPFDLISDRIVFTIVNLREEYGFEVIIDVSYGQVKGKNIDVINHVGQISKTNVQQLFDQLQPSEKRFFLFWQKLKKIHEL